MMGSHEMQVLFSHKNNKKKNKISSATNLHRALRVKAKQIPEGRPICTTLTLVMLNKLTPTSDFQPIRLLDLGY